MPESENKDRLCNFVRLQRLRFQSQSLGKCQATNLFFRLQGQPPRVTLRERRLLGLVDSPSTLPDFSSLPLVTHFAPTSFPRGRSRGKLPGREWKGVSASDPGNRQTSRQRGRRSQGVARALAKNALVKGSFAYGATVHPDLSPSSAGVRASAHVDVCLCALSGQVTIIVIAGERCGANWVWQQLPCSPPEDFPSIPLLASSFESSIPSHRSPHITLSLDLSLEFANWSLLIFVGVKVLQFRHPAGGVTLKKGNTPIATVDAIRIPGKVRNLHCESFTKEK
ncbi:hypothetical protein K0M31_007440 [Melipona bicolor]|uniref:Uncharacterized protein n=1 Tax=Melipona bicolor TaxID=60889 RepID=A0AA40GCA1_9HYME|nr:hypothetical protein K0M31_007440 [Melipona bicolor]